MPTSDFPLVARNSAESRSFLGVSCTFGPVIELISEQCALIAEDHASEGLTGEERRRSHYLLVE
jgi:hypothetical protein